MKPPLAERLRPKSLSEYVGQEHLVGEKGALTSLLQNKKIHSSIFWGPPGVGKTTLAKLLSKEIDTIFYQLNAVSSGVKDVREILEKAKNDKKLQRKTPILFIDEIHRFSKSQQDSLLRAVEEGTVTLIGATTENPSFEVISPLLSRCHVYTLESLNSKQLDTLIERAIKEDEDLKNLKIKESKLLKAYSGGDARKLLSYLELLAAENNNQEITDEKVKEILQKRSLVYDKKGEFHYDVISAFIKSIRGSDPQAALYYLAQMLVSGEDPIFIARRLLILASEDIGLANPNAAILAQSIFQTVHVIGMPEARIPLSELTVYLATSEKSNSVYTAIDKAISFVKKQGTFDVPLHLRNAPTELMKELDYGKEYKYAHNFENNFVEQEYLPKEISKIVFYIPSENKKESVLKLKQKKLWKNKYDLDI